VEVLSYLAILFASVLPVLYGLALYSGLVALRHHTRDAWAAVDAELERRYDLIPDLVAAVRNYAVRESAVLDEVAALRARCAANHGSVAAQAADESQLVSALTRLFVVAEDDPDFKASETFREFRTAFANAEDRIQAARRIYNWHVRGYREKCARFPSSLVASLFSFDPESFFEVEPVARAASPRG
jgi:LemA protein